MHDGQGAGLAVLSLVVALAIAACAAGSGGASLSPATRTQLRAAAVERVLQSLSDAERCTAVATARDALGDAASAADLASELAKGVGELTPSERRLIGALASEVQASLVAESPARVQIELADWQTAVRIAADDLALACR